MPTTPLPQATADDVLAISEQLGLGIGRDDAPEYAWLVTEQSRAYEVVADWGPTGGTYTEDRCFTIPDDADNPQHAWSCRTEITATGPEAAGGPLAGRTVAVKDSIPVAGVPFYNGSNLFDGYIPDFDAEVVTRLLAAGASITGKTHTEYLCLSGDSHTNYFADTQNPWREGYSAGGSSSGSGVVVALGEADMALGADQGGSIRCPASLCGVVGLKPTYGLVPYTGIATLEGSFDHVGPMTATVADNALMLSVIAGPDGVDPRQVGHEPDDYLAALDGGVEGLRIGVLKEGFEQPDGDARVNGKVRDAVRVLERLGATVVDVSVPRHADGLALWTPIGYDGVTATVFQGGGIGIGRDDYYPTSLMQWAFDHADRLADAPPSVKMYFLTSTFARRHVGNVGYGHAINAGRELRRAYDAVLADVDVLVMPTTPTTARPLIERGSATISEEVAAAVPQLSNTCPFDVTHHPGLSIPASEVDGLPVGMMLVGKHYDEATLYRVAAAYEATGEGRYR